MKIHHIKLFVFTVFSMFLVTCSKKKPDSPAKVIDQASLVKIEDALKSSDDNFVKTLNKIRGSVGTNGSGSKVIWSTKNDYNLGLYISANHVYGISTWGSLDEEFIDLNVINNGIFLGSRLPPTNGDVSLSNELVANFGLYHPQIPINSSNTTILPKDDFYLGIIDNQRIIDNGLANYPSPVQTSTPLKFYDPDLRGNSAQTWANPVDHEIIYALGFPQDRLKYPNGAVSVGRVYSNLEAEKIIESLKLKNDPEGLIPYDHEIEFIANTAAIAGMSGGGVFNANGQLLGIMVRATTLEGDPVLRVVRLKYIKTKMLNFYQKLTITNQNKFRPFISGELY